MIGNMQITIHAVVGVHREKAWGYYTQPVHITKWNFATDDWQCPEASNDMRIGGNYTARMEAKDGSFGFEFGGIYKTIVPNESYHLEMSDGRGVKVSFVEKEGGTLVSVTFDAENENDPEMQRAGWQAILDNFKKYAESH
jgi:uncharacterized protein YndB with AHSA1/START domain